MLHEVPALTQARGVGSGLALDAQDAALGILTRGGLLPRIALCEPPLDIRRTPALELMNGPVHTRDIGQTVQDAALLMSRAGTHQVPLTERRARRQPGLRAQPVRAAAPRALAPGMRDLRRSCRPRA